MFFACKISNVYPALHSVTGGYTPSVTRTIVWVTPAGWWTDTSRSPDKRDALVAFREYVAVYPVNTYNSDLTVEQRINLLALIDDALRLYDNTPADPNRVKYLDPYVKVYSPTVNNGLVLF